MINLENQVINTDVKEGNFDILICIFQDFDLAPMHGTKAFMEFIDKKSTRRPEVFH